MCSIVEPKSAALRLNIKNELERLFLEILDLSEKMTPMMTKTTKTSVTMQLDRKK